MTDSVHDVVSLAAFVSSVAFASKDASWDAWLVECLQENDLKVCCAPIGFQLSFLWCQAVEDLADIRMEDLRLADVTPGKYKFAKVRLNCASFSLYLHALWVR